MSFATGSLLHTGNTVKESPPAETEGLQLLLGIKHNRRLQNSEVYSLRQYYWEEGYHFQT